MTEPYLSNEHYALLEKAMLADTTGTSYDERIFLAGIESQQQRIAGAHSQCFGTWQNGDGSSGSATDHHAIEASKVIHQNATGGEMNGLRAIGSTGRLSYILGWGARYMSRSLTPSAIAIVVALLVGCATPQPIQVGTGVAPPLPAVQVPVLVPCISPEQLEPDPPSMMPPRTAGVAELAAGAAADALRYRELARKRGEMLKACATKPEAK